MSCFYSLSLSILTFSFLRYNIWQGLKNIWSKAKKNGCTIIILRELYPRFFCTHDNKALRCWILLVQGLWMSCKQLDTLSIREPYPHSCLGVFSALVLLKVLNLWYDQEKGTTKPNQEWFRLKPYGFETELLKRNSYFFYTMPQG